MTIGVTIQLAPQEENIEQLVLKANIDQFVDLLIVPLLGLGYPVIGVPLMLFLRPQIKDFAKRYIETIELDKVSSQNEQKPPK